MTAVLEVAAEIHPTEVAAVVTAAAYESDRLSTRVKRGKRVQGKRAGSLTNG